MAMRPEYRKQRVYVLGRKAHNETVILILLTLFCLTLFGVFLFFWGYSTARFRQSVKDKETARLVAQFKVQFDAMHSLAKAAVSALPETLDKPEKVETEEEEWADIIGE